MTRLGAILWIVLSVLLLLFPIGIITYYIIRYFKKSSEFVSKKIEEIKELDSMKDTILHETDEKQEKDSLNKDESSGSVDVSYKKDKKSKKNIQKVDNASSSSDTAQQDKTHTEKKVADSIIQKLEVPTVGKPTSTPEQEQVQKDIEQRQKKILEKIRYEAVLCKEKWKIDDFEKKLVEWLAIDPHNLELNQMLADLYFTLGNYKKSLTLLKKIIEIEPQDHKAIWQIGEIYLSKWEFETAELLIEKAIDIKPSNPKYHISMVEIYYNTDRKDLSVDTLEKVVKLRPANVPYALALADLYFELGDMESAQRYYFRVLEYEPSNVKAKAKLQKIV